MPILNQNDIQASIAADDKGTSSLSIEDSIKQDDELTSVSQSAAAPDDIQASIAKDAEEPASNLFQDTALTLLDAANPAGRIRGQAAVGVGKAISETAKTVKQISNDSPVGLGDIADQFIPGLGKTADSIFSSLSQIIKKVEKDYPPKNLIEGFAKEAGRVGAGIVPASKAVTTLGVTNKFYNAMATGALVDFSVFDATEVRLSNLIESNEKTKNFVTGFLAADEDDTFYEGKIKNVIEGAVLGGGAVSAVKLGTKTFDEVIKGLRLIKAKRTVLSNPPAKTMNQADVQESYKKIKEIKSNYIATKEDKFRYEKEILRQRLQEGMERSKAQQQAKAEAARRYDDRLTRAQEDLIDSEEIISGTSNKLSASKRIAIQVENRASDFWREFTDITAGKQISYMYKKSPYSPTLKKLVNSIEHSTNGKTPVRADYTERVDLNRGRFITELRGILKPFKSKYRGKLSGKTNQSLLKIMRGEAGNNPSLRIASKKLRELMDSLYSYIRVGDSFFDVRMARLDKNPIIDIGYLRDQVPRVYRRKVSRGQRKAGKFSVFDEKGSKAFERVLIKNGISKVDAAEVSYNIRNGKGLFGDIPTKLKSNELAPEGLDIRKTGSELGRKLKQVPDSELAPFLEDDLEGILKNYIDTMVQRVEVARITGQSGKKIAETFDNIKSELAESGQKLTPKEENRMLSILNKMQGLDAIDAPWLKSIYDMNATYQAVSKLTFSTLSSAAEPFVMLFTNRLSAVAKASLDGLNHSMRESVRMIYKDFPMATATKFSDEIGVSIDESMSELITTMFSTPRNKLTEAYFKVIFLSQWTRLNRVVAASARKYGLIKNLQDLKKWEQKTGLAIPQSGRDNRKYFKSMLVNKRFRELVDMGIEPREGLKWLDEGMPENSSFYQNDVKTAAIRGTHEAVMNPRVANSPALSTNPYVKPIYQFKRFILTFTNTVGKQLVKDVTTRGVKENFYNGGRIAMISSAMMITALYSNKLREMMKFGAEGNPRFKNESTGKEMYRATDRTGLTFAFQIVNDMYNADRFGSEDRPFIQPLGPTINQLSNLQKAYSNLDKDPEGLKREFVEGIPLLNFNKTTRDATKRFIFDPSYDGETDNSLNFR